MSRLFSARGATPDPADDQPETGAATTSRGQERRSRRSRRRWSWAAGLVGLVAVVLAGVMLIGGTGQTGQRLVDLSGNLVEADPGAVPTSDAATAAVAATEDDGSRLVVPTAGLDVALGSMNEVDGQITPPGFTSAYVVRNEGVSLDEAQDGSVFVVMHSLRNGGDGPGNYLIDVDHARASVQVGDEVEAGGLTYTVTSTEAISKTDLPDRSDVWANTPGRLVMITCLQRADGKHSTENMVITATLAQS